jgi:thioredoxin reductase (NADPH)
MCCLSVGVRPLVRGSWASEGSFLRSKRERPLESMGQSLFWCHFLDQTEGGPRERGILFLTGSSKAKDNNKNKILMNEQFTQSLIIGGGPAGYTAAIYLARYGRNPTVVTGPEPGGQLTLTTEVENFPGFREPVQGPWLMEEFAAQAAAYGAQLHQDKIIEVDFSKAPFVCQGEKTRYLCQTVIIATGASTKWLGLDSETFFRGYGVSSCATCDGRLFRGKDVVIVGGGNTAVEEALFLAQHVNSVTLIHRRNALRADKVLQERLFAHKKVHVLWDHVVEEVRGTEAPKSVNAVVVKNVRTGDLATLSVQGVFVAIGHKPNTHLFRSFLEVDTEGYLVGTPGSSESSIPGVFMAGDVQDKTCRQAITAAGQGCMASMDAERFLQAQ